MAAMAGIDHGSDGLARAARMGVPTTADGVDGLMAMPGFGDIRLVFDATSASAHRANWNTLQHKGVRVLDLTPASVGPFCVPVVNVDEHLDAPNLNMVTCGGQATVPVVAAIAKNGIVSSPRSCRRYRRGPQAPAHGPASTSSSKPPRRQYKSSGAHSVLKTVMTSTPPTHR